MTLKEFLQICQSRSIEDLTTDYIISPDPEVLKTHSITFSDYYKTIKSVLLSKQKGGSCA